MRKYIFLLIVLNFLSSGCEDNPEQQIADYSYGIIQAKEKKLKQIYFDASLDYSFEYNNENLTKITKHYSDESSTEEILIYDERNRLVTRIINDSWQENYIYKDNKLTELHSVPTDSYAKNWSSPILRFMYNESGQIVRADKIQNEKLIGIYDYTYDLQGNVSRITEYAVSGDENMLISEIKCEYDDKILPLKMLNLFPLDMAQINNPIYAYKYFIYHSSLPLEYRSVFEYDSEGYPVKEVRTSLYRDEVLGTNELRYVYE